MKPSLVCAVIMWWLCGFAGPAAMLADDPPTQPPLGRQRRVLLVVWDGLRPDFVRADTTPTLFKLASEGTTFTRHHSVYPTSTEVNGTAIATGCYPQRSGIIGNREYRPAIEASRPVDTQELRVIRRGDELTGGRYLAVPTLPEILQGAGHPTVVAGTKGVAWLIDRSPLPFPAEGPLCASLVRGESVPPDVAEEVRRKYGEFFSDEKGDHLPNTPADRWTRHGLTDVLWRRGVPALSVLWLSEPDFSQHKHGIGSEKSLAALAGDDAQLAAVLTALRDKGLAGSTDMILVSDHGFSTISEGVLLERSLAEAGFSAHREYKAPPAPGSILVDSLGSSIFLYVTGHDRDTIERLVTHLQNLPYTGPVFTRGEMAGTFPLEAAHIDTPAAPDVVVTLRWSDEKNAAGVPGSAAANGERVPGQGSHASLSPWDIHNTCIAWGPDFRKGFKIETPSSNLDVAPTIAYLLGCAFPEKVDGRVLKEALPTAAQDNDKPIPSTKRQTASRDVPGGHWEQYLQETTYDGETYIDGGGSTLTLLPAK